MNAIRIVGDSRSFLTHFAAYGLAAIAEAELGTVATVAIDSMKSIVVATSDPSQTPIQIASAVQRHAERHMDSWVKMTHVHVDKPAGTMSPRLKLPTEPSHWHRLQVARWEALDSVSPAQGGWLDLMFMGALGEPAYWYVGNDGKPQPDRGASGWEMKTRNRGEEFIQNRLSLLCDAVARRSFQQVLDGLTGVKPVDEVGGDSVTSRTPTGLARPGATDNALAWCALWGISLFPVAHNASPGIGTSRGSGKQSVAAGIIRGLPKPADAARAVTYLPLFRRPLRLARLKTIIVSAALARVAAMESLKESRPRWPGKEIDRWSELLQRLSRPADREWLRRKGCSALLLSYIHASDNPNAPELHVVSGRIHPIEAGST